MIISRRFVLKVVSNTIFWSLSLKSTVSTISGSGLKAATYPKTVYRVSLIDGLRNATKSVCHKILAKKIKI
jgi:hypothetical protein